LSDFDRWNFPFRDLSRRKFQAGLTVFSLAICIAVTLSLLLLGENLGVEVTSFVQGGLTVGFSGVYSRFLLIVVVFNSVAGILVASFLIRLAIADRVRDIGIMKAVGCLTDDVFKFFGTELLVIVLASCLIGTIGGVVLNFASVFLMNSLGFAIGAQPPNPWLIALVFVFFAFVSYVLGMRLIGKAVRVEPVRALSPTPISRSVRRSGLRFPGSSAGGFLARMASRDLGRRRSLTLQYLACLSAIIAMTTLAVVGGIVADETMRSYVERAVGRNVVLVAKAEMAEKYWELLETFIRANQKEQKGKINYPDEKYLIPEPLISDLAEINGVVKIDPRLVLEDTVYEHQTVIPDPDEPDRYILIGDFRHSSALVVGVHTESIVNNWLVLGEGLVKESQDTVLIADSLASTLFQDPWQQSLVVLNLQFTVAGVCLDPLNNGMVVYVSFDRLSALVKPAGYNLLLLQIDASDSSRRSMILDKIEGTISGTGLTVFDLNEIVHEHGAFLSHIWSLMLSLSLFSFVNAILSLTGYLMLSISGQQRDLGIVRALGATPRTVVKLVLVETLMLVLAGVLIGLPIGAIVVFWFFIPEAVVSQTATLSMMGLISVLICALCLASLHPARRIARTPITKAVSQA